MGALGTEYAPLINAVDRRRRTNSIIPGVNGLAAGQQNMTHRWAAIIVQWAEVGVAGRDVARLAHANRQTTPVAVQVIAARDNAIGQPGAGIPLTIAVAIAGDQGIGQGNQPVQLGNAADAGRSVAGNGAVDQPHIGGVKF